MRSSPNKANRNEVPTKHVAELDALILKCRKRKKTVVFFLSMTSRRRERSLSCSVKPVSVLRRENVFAATGFNLDPPK